MTRQVSLLVNDQPVELDYFVQGFIDHTIGGMLVSLKWLIGPVWLCKPLVWKRSHSEPRAYPRCLLTGGILSVVLVEACGASLWGCRM